LKEPLTLKRSRDSLSLPMELHPPRALGSPMGRRGISSKLNLPEQIKTGGHRHTLSLLPGHRFAPLQLPFQLQG
jgi:hypothetical protein